ncbi:MAG: GDP-mannose 4,6-dehydratase, partial [Mangrovibacterium sp.]|nr:GDP-mannose 4,6-dehydratase [Mangrovibacterium sp.]
MHRAWRMVAAASCGRVQLPAGDRQLMAGGPRCPNQSQFRYRNLDHHGIVNLPDANTYLVFAFQPDQLSANAHQRSREDLDLPAGNKVVTAEFNLKLILLQNPFQRTDHLIALGMQDRLYLGNLSGWRDWGHAKDYIRAMYLI